MYEKCILRLKSSSSKQYVGQDYTQKKATAAGKVTLDQIDSVSFSTKITRTK